MWCCVVLFDVEWRVQHVMAPLGAKHGHECVRVAAVVRHAVLIWDCQREASESTIGPVCVQQEKRGLIIDEQACLIGSYPTCAN